MKPRPPIAIVSVFLLAVLAGCVSVEKRYKKGQELEAKGRLEEAAQRYITVLTKDPNMEEARRSLADVGARVVDEYWRGPARTSRTASMKAPSRRSSVSTACGAVRDR
ncbi:MAG: hypothetical protein EHM31_12600 [Candidatus Aminicenantes bacterium]|nr:MAG: hypothetical protein EHM31_12600 [Candidatus Aminicenantes bacterium]